MNCNKKINLKNGWNRYCTGLKWLGFKNDTIWGLYLGCPCKTHDIHYSYEGNMKKQTADFLFRQNIKKQGIIQNKRVKAFFIKWIFWLFVNCFGFLFWKTWSSKGVQRYK